jgi:hypothetical protein
VAAVDSVQILAALDGGMSKAEQAAAGNISWAQWLDSLLTIADALNGLHEKHEAFNSSRE